MKKNFKRKNYVLIGAIGIAAVALTSVGFATWITGMQQPTDDSTISVAVDTARNDTKYIEATLEESKLYLGEPTSESQTGEKINITNGKATDLSIKFSSFRVIVSDIYDPSTISVEMTVSFSDGAKAAYLPAKRGFTNKTGEQIGTKTYIAFPTTFVNNGVVKLNPKKSSLTGYYERVLESNTIELTGGDTFGEGNIAPSKYYNDQLTSDKTLDQKLELMSTATKTLNEMYTALNGQTITLHFEVNATLKSAQQS